MIRQFLFFIFLFIFSCLSDIGYLQRNAYAQQVISNERCSVYDAIYKPISSSENKINFEMRVIDNSEEGFPLERGAFYIFTAKDHNNNPVSSMRLANTCSPHFNECWADAYYGQYAAIGSNEWHSFKSPLFFDIISFDKNYEPKGDYLKTDSEAPYIFIFSNSVSKFSKNKSFKSDWEKYTRFYTSARVFPDFSGIEIWKISRCTNKNL